MTLPVAAWRGRPGCEVTVLSNWVLGRDDQIGCPLFAPVDSAERELGRSSAPRPSDSTSGPRWGTTLVHLGVCCGVGAAIVLGSIFL